jgi:hypothetical protein
MITPEKLVRQFENPAISTYSARCPVCRQNSLRIYCSSEGTGCRCINGCRRTDILAQVGLPPADLRPDLSCLTTPPAPSANAQVLPVEKDAIPGGQQ